MNIGEKIVKLRKQNHMSQEMLAAKLNVSRQSVSKWELNDATPDAFNLLELSKLFNVTTDYLLYDDYKSDDDIPRAKEVMSDFKESKGKEIRNTFIQAFLWLIAAIGLNVSLYFNLISPWLLHLGSILSVIFSLLNFYKYQKLRNNNYQTIDILLMKISALITILITYSLNRYTYTEIAFFAIVSMVVVLSINKMIVLARKK